MMITRHSLTALGLCLFLALTSQSMAVARGAAQPVGHVVLCTGTGPVSVAVDATGQPTGTPHICPDCMLGLFGETPAAPDAAHRAAATAAPRLTEITRRPAGSEYPAFTARAPPTV